MHDKSRHGGRSAEYVAWQGMKSRCTTNKQNYCYRHYAGRGISVCKRWRESFAAFLEDMGRKPSPELSLDRINNDGNYEPENCRWATDKEQANNKRIGKRPKMYKNPKKISLHMPGALLRRIERYAKADRRSLNSAVVMLLKQELEKDKKLSASS